MRDIRQEMWKRAKHRIYDECLRDAFVGEYKYDYDINIMIEYKLIFGELM